MRDIHFLRSRPRLQSFLLIGFISSSFQTNADLLKNEETESFKYATSTGCSDNENPSCLRCGPGGCMKCPSLILADSRRCVEECPSGYTEKWSTTPEFMGRMCLQIRLSSSITTIVVGVTIGVILCLVVLLVTIIVMRRGRSKHKKRHILTDDTVCRQEYLRQLNELRPHSESFLHMLNDTRRQVRKLHLSGDETAAEAYNSLIRDLAKILILLNRPVELLSEPPHDWRRLYNWAERALDCYKPQIEQLIEFLQSPSNSENIDHRLASSQHSTFRAVVSSRVPASKTQELIGSLISLHELNNSLEGSHNEDEQSGAFGEAFDHVRSYLSSSSERNSGIWLDDEFYKLGRRPQDELTTEL